MRTTRMAVRDVFRVFADGGSTTDDLTHYECRRCSQNLTADHEQCPDCGAGIAVYHIE